jgi:hypothetical protein
VVIQRKEIDGACQSMKGNVVIYIHIMAATQLPVRCDIDRAMMVVALRLPISGVMPAKMWLAGCGSRP